MMDNHEAKAYLIIDPTFNNGEIEKDSAGLLIADFDTIEEARSFIIETDNPNYVIFGPYGSKI